MTATRYSVDASEGVVTAAGLDDIIDSKRSANRPKELMALAYLESRRDEINRG